MEALLWLCLEEKQPRHHVWCSSRCCRHHVSQCLVSYFRLKFLLVKVHFSSRFNSSLAACLLDHRRLFFWHHDIWNVPFRTILLLNSSVMSRVHANVSLCLYAKIMFLSQGVNRVLPPRLWRSGDPVTIIPVWCFIGERLRGVRASPIPPPLWTGATLAMTRGAAQRGFRHAKSPAWRWMEEPSPQNGTHVLRHHCGVHLTLLSSVPCRVCVSLRHDWHVYYNITQTDRIKHHETPCSCSGTIN